MLRIILWPFLAMTASATSTEPIIAVLITDEIAEAQRLGLIISSVLAGLSSVEQLLANGAAFQDVRNQLVICDGVLKWSAHVELPVEGAIEVPVIPVILQSWILHRVRALSADGN